MYLPSLPRKSSSRLSLARDDGDIDIDGGFGRRPFWTVVLVALEACITGLLLLVVDLAPRAAAAAAAVVDPGMSGDPLRNMDTVLLACPVLRVSGLPAGSGSGFRSLNPGEILEDDDDGEAEVLRPPCPPRCVCVLGGVPAFVRLCALCRAIYVDAACSCRCEGDGRVGASSASCISSDFFRRPHPNALLALRETAAAAVTAVVGLVRLLSGDSAAPMFLRRLRISSSTSSNELPSVVVLTAVPGSVLTSLVAFKRVDRRGTTGDEASANRRDDDDDDGAVGNWKLRIGAGAFADLTYE